MKPLVIFLLLSGQAYSSQLELLKTVDYYFGYDHDTLRQHALLHAYHNPSDNKENKKEEKKEKKVDDSDNLSETESQASTVDVNKERE